MEAIQSNTIVGRMAFTADGDLTGKEGYLVKLTTGTDGKAEVKLPTDVADVCPYVIVDVPEASYTAGDKVYVKPLTSGEQVRLVAANTITAGDRVLLSGTFGKVITETAAGADAYWSPGYAEEDAAAGGYVAVRYYPAAVTVS